MRRSGKHRTRRLNMFGSTEEFEARREKFLRRNDPNAIPVNATDLRRRIILRNSLDPRVTAIYEFCTKHNKDNPDNEWLSVDHIRPIVQPGCEHIFSNLRIIPISKNFKVWRSDALIDRITRRVAAGRGACGLFYIDTGVDDE